MTLKLHNSNPKDPYTKQLCGNDVFVVNKDKMDQKGNMIEQ